MVAKNKKCTDIAHHLRLLSHVGDDRSEPILRGDPLPGDLLDRGEGFKVRAVQRFQKPQNT